MNIFRSKVYFDIGWSVTLIQLKRQRQDREFFLHFKYTMSKLKPFLRESIKSYGTDTFLKWFPFTVSPTFYKTIFENNYTLICIAYNLVTLYRDHIWEKTNNKEQKYHIPVHTFNQECELTVSMIILM